jgi:hypothetical protein
MQDEKRSTDLFGIAPYGEAIKEATTRSLDAAGAFLSRICLPAAEEYGLMLRDKVAARRARLAADRVAEAAQMIAAAGAEPREVPMRTLAPLLEGASIEDDPELTRLWSALLANAAFPASPIVPPIFPATLRQLSPLDARILAGVRDRLTRELEPDPEPNAPPRWGIKRREITSDLPSVDESDVEVSLTTLISLGLLANEPVLRADGQSIFYTDAEEFRLSPLGRKFLEACDPPRSAPGAV